MAENETEASLGQLALVPLQSPKMTTIDIATTDGDILLVLGDTRLRVSSVILSSASPVFKAMLGPNFSEGQGDRSAQSPKEVALIDDDLATMARLCRLLHHQRDLSEASQDGKPLDARARELFDLAVLADKYGSTESIEMAGGYLLFHMAITKPEDVPIAALVFLIAAAFMLGDHRHLALFTRRLVIDHIDNYSTISHHPALTMLPNLFFILIEEQRKNVWLVFYNKLTSMASSNCCGRSGTDYNIFATLVNNMPRYRHQGPNFWPPSNCSLRFVLQETYGNGSSCNYQPQMPCGHRLGTYAVSVTDLKTLCDRVNKAALGLCLTCLRNVAEDDPPAECLHSPLERWVENDPFI